MTESALDPAKLEEIRLLHTEFITKVNSLIDEYVEKGIPPLIIANLVAPIQTNLMVVQVLNEVAERLTLAQQIFNHKGTGDGPAT